MLNSFYTYAMTTNTKNEIISLITHMYKRVEVSSKIVNVLEKEISKLELPNYNKISFRK